MHELVAAAAQRQQAGAFEEAVELWRECLWRFPQHEDRPSWVSSYAQALFGSGEAARAASVYGRMQSLYPGRAEGFSGLALLFQHSGAHDRSASMWARVLAQFPAHPDRRWWLPSAAFALIELGCLEEAEELCRKAMSEFPEASGSSAALSLIAERRFLWEEALVHAERALALCSGGERQPLIVSKLRILREMGAITSCENILRAELPREGQQAGLFAAAAELSEITGPVDEAVRRWDRCIRERPNAQAGFIGRALLHCAMGELEAGEALLREACRRWPRSARLRQVLAETCAQRRDIEAARRAWQEALRLAPLSLPVLFAHCMFLGALGARDEFGEMLRARDAPEPVQWRCRFEYAKAARELDDALACLAEVRRASPSSAVDAFAEAEIRSWRQDPGDLEEAARILRAMTQASPAAVRAAALLAGVLVLLGEAKGAAQVVQSLPEEDQRRSVSEARLWLHIQQGDGHAAASQWRDLEQRFFLPALHLPRAGLNMVRQGPASAAGGGILLLSVIRNELPRLPGFLDHYRKLGVTGFAIVDNGSGDGSTEFMAAQPDVTLYATHDSYAESAYGARWLNQMMDAHGGNGWIVYADADERLVFAGCEDRPITELADYLTKRGHQVVAGVMLDMFPRRAGRPSASEAMAGDASHVWFDPLRIRPSITCPYIEAAGGARRRLFGTTVTLSKAPLVRAGSGVRYLNSHSTSPGIVSDVRVALLHYHLEFLFDEAYLGRVRDEVYRAQHSDHAVDRRRSIRMLEERRQGELTGKQSLPYTGSDQLLQLGLISTSAEFEASRTARVVRT